MCVFTSFVTGTVSNSFFYLFLALRDHPDRTHNQLATPFGAVGSPPLCPFFLPHFQVLLFSLVVVLVCASGAAPQGHQGHMPHVSCNVQLRPLHDARDRGYRWCRTRFRPAAVFGARGLWVDPSASALSIGPRHGFNDPSPTLFQPHALVLDPHPWLLCSLPCVIRFQRRDTGRGYFVEEEEASHTQKTVVARPGGGGLCWDLPDQTQCNVTREGGDSEPTSETPSLTLYGRSVRRAQLRGVDATSQLNSATSPHYRFNHAILRATTAQEILSVMEENLNELDLFHCSLAVHRLAKHGRVVEAPRILRHPTWPTLESRSPVWEYLHR